MGRLRQPTQSVEQLRPFLANRREFFLPLGSQAITAAAPAIAAGFPAPMNPASLLDAVKHGVEGDRKSTRLNSSHQIISYAVFCLKKKNTQQTTKTDIR